MLTRWYVNKKCRGVTMIEYILIAALVSIAAIAVLGTVGTKVQAAWTTIGNALP